MTPDERKALRERAEKASPFSAFRADVLMLLEQVELAEQARDEARESLRVEREQSHVVIERLRAERDDRPKISRALAIRFLSHETDRQAYRLVADAVNAHAGPEALADAVAEYRKQIEPHGT